MSSTFSKNLDAVTSRVSSSKEVGGGDLPKEGGSDEDGSDIVDEEPCEFREGVALDGACDDLMVPLDDECVGEGCIEFGVLLLTVLGCL